MEKIKIIKNLLESKKKTSQDYLKYNRDYYRGRLSMISIIEKELKKIYKNYEN